MSPAASEPGGYLLRFGPGIALSAALAALAMVLGGIGWLQSHGMSPLTVAILLGIVVANTVYARLADTCGPGVNFSKQTLLHAGVILYGLRLTLQDIGHVGIAGVLIDAVVLTDHARLCDPRCGRQAVTVGRGTLCLAHPWRGIHQLSRGARTELNRPALS